MFGNHFFRYAIAGDLAVTHFLCDCRASIRDFGTSAVIQAEHHVDGRVVFGTFLCFFQFVDNGFP